jgi:hypothetical protein
VQKLAQSRESVLIFVGSDIQEVVFLLFFSFGVVFAYFLSFSLPHIHIGTNEEKGNYLASLKANRTHLICTCSKKILCDNRQTGNVEANYSGGCF